MLTINYPFDDAGDYSIDSKLEITGGKVQNKSIIPANATFYAKFDSTINGNWGGGILTGTAVGGAAVSGGKLDLTGGIKRVDYSAVGNADSPQTGCIRFKWTPNYSGAPAGDRWIFSISKAHNDNKNAVSLRHRNSASALVLNIKDLNGNVITEYLTGTFTPIAGTEYEIEINYDLTAGAIRFFVNGMQLGTTSTATGTRDSNIGLFRLGDIYYVTGVSADCKLDDFIVFSTVQHTANYTPDWSGIPEWKYSTDALPVQPNTTFRSDKLDSIEAVKSDNVRFILVKDGTTFYWTGTAWAASDGTWSKANEIDDLNQEVLNEFLTSAANVKWKALLKSDGTIQEYIDDLTIGFSFAGASPEVNTVTVWGYLYELNGVPKSGITIKARTMEPAYGENVILLKNVMETQSDESGYWELDLAYASGSVKTKVFFTIDGKNYYKLLPAQDTAKFEDLENFISAR